MHAIRQATLDAHYARHPERYASGPPIAKRPPVQVAINPADGLHASASDLLSTPRAFTQSSPNEENQKPVVVT